MSHVTAVVLMMSSREEDSLGVLPPPLAALQAWLRRADAGQLVAVDQRFCGWQHPGIACLGGFNHLDVEGFVAIFHEQDWRHPEQAVLVLTTEGEPAQVHRPSRQRLVEAKFDPAFISRVAMLWQSILRVEHSGFFAGSEAQGRDRSHGYDRLPQPGFVGALYQPGGVLLLGQNPGTDPVGKGLSTTDQLQYRLLERLRDAMDEQAATDAAQSLMQALGEEVMPTWRIIRTVVAPLLDGLGLSLCDVAYTNLVKFRTKDSGFRAALYRNSWELTETQIRLLAPSIIIALGAQTFSHFRRHYSGSARVFRIRRGIGDSFLPEGGREDIAVILAAMRPST